MEFGTYKLIELVMLFGLCFVFGFWQLRSVNKAISERKAREEEGVTKNAVASETVTSS